jgi:hypothetical protein
MLPLHTNVNYKVIIHRYEKSLPNQSQFLLTQSRVKLQRILARFPLTQLLRKTKKQSLHFRNEGLIAYKCILKTADGQRTLGIGHGINVLSAENRYLSKSVKWAHSGAFIAAVTNAVKFPTLDGVPVSDFGVGNSEIASAFMATEKQKSRI